MAYLFITLQLACIAELSMVGVIMFTGPGMANSYLSTILNYHFYSMYSVH